MHGCHIGHASRACRAVRVSPATSDGERRPRSRDRSARGTRPMRKNSSFGGIAAQCASRLDSAKSATIAPTSQTSSSVRPCSRRPAWSAGGDRGRVDGEPDRHLEHRVHPRRPAAPCASRRRPGRRGRGRGPGSGRSRRAPPRSRGSRWPRWWRRRSARGRPWTAPGVSLSMSASCRAKKAARLGRPPGQRAEDVRQEARALLDGVVPLAQLGGQLVARRDGEAADRGAASGIVGHAAPWRAACSTWASAQHHRVRGR